MSDRPSDEVVARMEALVRTMARPTTETWGGDYKVARAIAAELPKPVDPVVLAARVICAEHWPTYSKSYLGGYNDGNSDMKIAIAAYRAGQAPC